MQLELGREVGAVITNDVECDGICDGCFVESTRFSYFDTAPARTALLHDCICLIAGHAVEAHLLLYWTHRVSRRAVREKQEVERVVQLVEPDRETALATQRYVERTACAMLDDADVMYRLQRLGEVLGRRAALTSDDVAKVIRDVDALMPLHGRVRWRRARLSARPLVHPASPTLRPAGAVPASDPTGTPIEALGLSPFALSTLRKRGGIDTIEQLRTYTREQLLSIRTLGRQTLTEIAEALRRLGIWRRW